MVLVILICIIFTTVRHREGFGQFERNGDCSLFFINENKRLEVFVDGYPTGIVGNGLIFISDKKSEVTLEFRLGDQIIESRKVVINEPAQWVVGPVGVPLFTVAREEALV